MAANNPHVEYSSCLAIAVPLDDTCKIIHNAPSFVTAGFVEINGAWETEDGQDYSAKNFGGQNCGPELKNKARKKWLNLSGNMCMVNWGFLGMATGNPLTLDADDNVVGYGEEVTPPTSPCDPSTNPKFALAVVTRAAVGDGGCDAGALTDGASNCKLHIYGLVTDFDHEPVSHKDERRIVAFTAKAYPNPNIGRGPWNLYPADYVPTSMASTLPHWEGFVPCTGLPTPSDDVVLHPAVIAPA